MLWKVIWCAEGEDQGSLDSLPVQAKLANWLALSVDCDSAVLTQLTSGSPIAGVHAARPIHPIS